MELAGYFKSIIDQDICAIVVCNLEHTIVYMNPAAIERYHKYGGAALLGKNLLGCHNAQSRASIERVLQWFRESSDHNRVYTFYNEKENKDVYMVALRAEDASLAGYYEKHEYRNRETSERYHFS